MPEKRQVPENAEPVDHRKGLAFGDNPVSVTIRNPKDGKERLVVIKKDDGSRIPLSLEDWIDPRKDFNGHMKKNEELIKRYWVFIKQQCPEVSGFEFLNKNGRVEKVVINSPEDYFEFFNKKK